MKSVPGRRGSNEGNESGIEPDVGWVEASGELILGAGFREAGFQCGRSADEYRDANFRADSPAGWARAKRGRPRLFERIGTRD